MKTSERITEIKQKVDNQLLSFPIGTKPYLIDGIRGGSVNNLEEQLLIGMESTVTSWKDADGVIHTEEEYCSLNSTDNHYKIEILDYCSEQLGPNNQDYDIVTYTEDIEETQILLLPDQLIDINNGEIKIDSPLNSIYNIKNSVINIDPSVEIVIKIVNLYFGGVKIMTKTYTRKYVDDKKIVVTTIKKY